MASDGLPIEPEVLSAILDGRRFAYALTDGSLRVRTIKDPAHLVAASQEAAIGQSLLDLAPELVGSEDDLERMSAGEQVHLGMEMVNRVDVAGETRYHRVLVKPRQPDKNHTQGVVYLVQDVTEIGEMQQRLMQSRNELLLLRDALDSKNRELAAANQELRKLADMKSTFVSIAAHELRTPLAIMQGYADMLLHEAFGALTEGQREALTTLCQSVDRLLGIVNNLLDLARLETGRIELVLQTLDLAAVVRAAAKEYRPLFEAAQQRLAVTIPPDLPAALCDEARVFQIVGNLLSNASRYTPKGGQIELGVGVIDAPGELVVWVRDNGVGIPLDEQERLGTLFFRARTADLVDAHGAGLGLHITRALVHLHGGRFWFESVEGQGSTFSVTVLMASQPEA
jgi:signal transduction histidine kinase